MSELDSLIDELFPEKHNNESNCASAPGPSRRRSEWDEESDDGQDIRMFTGSKMHALQQRNPTSVSSSRADPSTSATTVAPTRCLAGHSFDEDGDADGDVGHAVASHNVPGELVDKDLSARSLTRMSKPVLFPVPFPSLSGSEGSYACASRCYLTNLGTPLIRDAGHPTLQQLRAIAANEQASLDTSRIQAMLRKGAFHAAIAKLGNGCLDHHGDFTVDGGCPNILCRQCNYMVVRLQGAEWDDDGVNLYLTLRNYYPDWCRLASATPVGVEDGAEASRGVLRSSSAAAAYCCQCSWVTVRSAKMVIETRLTDITMAKPAREGEHPFATKLPLPLGEKRRPPLWVCHGHTQ
ncbi:Cilia- and flagella-associated protein 418 [Leishmania donovani]|uniref:Cilia- and flagella-associated protein 418 n=1 Tax=Leishmania donovani TaxID=5661 RepID=A0A3S7X892_LEIDO|nr:hypothetical protein, conserved [Leishmania donovani]AYU82645.1 Retinal Maintenance, putative [Leishmania donovani]TPP40189.1 Retinal Maintenance family protein [Leishmania donovani]TPP46814.1 Retinal Maintenance family protein [Leishmania donovani]CAJ1992662.1 Cilia- and flagella-associated protein 418 [Leishmania donovani]CBZ37763.1 hypothetical protein, conserved [Leishmania donovani]